MKSLRPPNTEVANAVGRLLRPTEFVRGWEKTDDRHITAYLMDRDAVAQAQRMEAIGLAGGEGRAIHFVCINGIWIQSHESKWIA
jgi:hypothetical protein